MTLANGCSKIKRPSKLSLLVAMEWNEMKWRGEERRRRQLLTHASLLLPTPGSQFLLSSCPIMSTNPSFVHPPLPSINSSLVHSHLDPLRFTLSLLQLIITPSHCRNRFHPSLCITEHTHINSIISPPTLLLTITQYQHQVLNIHNNYLTFLV